MSELFAGKYLLKERLGVGGMAEVWLAELKGPQGFSRQLVIKRILPHLADDDNFITMFEDEARLAARLNHPHACGWLSRAARRASSSNIVMKLSSSAR